MAPGSLNRTAKGSFFNIKKYVWKVRENIAEDSLAPFWDALTKSPTQKPENPLIVDFRDFR